MGRGVLSVQAVVVDVYLLAALSLLAGWYVSLGVSPDQAPPQHQQQALQV
jgi:hypothetical protein